MTHDQLKEACLQFIEGYADQNKRAELNLILIARTISDRPGETEVTTDDVWDAFKALYNENKIDARIRCVINDGTASLDGYQ